MALAVSNYNLQSDNIEGEVTSHRCVNDLDLKKRLAPGTIYAPAIYDDGPLAHDLAAHIKVYIDPSEEEASFKARWGSCRFEKHQADDLLSAFDHDAEPPYAVDYLVITHDTFVNMIRIALPRGATHEDLQAICNRAMTIPFGRNKIYINDPPCH